MLCFHEFTLYEYLWMIRDDKTVFIEKIKKININLRYAAEKN
jgi:hypothetical protein